MGPAQALALVPPVDGSQLALSELRIAAGDECVIGDPEHDSLIYVVAGSGSLLLGDVSEPLAGGVAALVLAGEESRVAAAEALTSLRATVGPAADRHAPLGRREVVARLDDTDSERATGARSFQVLFGPHTGSTRATLFAGYIPPGRAPWHYHLYDEIVWVPRGPGRLHIGDETEDLAAGSAFRLRPRQVHIVENLSSREELTVIGIFTPAGSPSAAYLTPEAAAEYRFAG